MLCRVDGCERPVYVASRQLCSRHYNRLITTGSVEDGPRARLSLEERFWRKVKVGAPDECWPWLGASKVRGYGTISAGGRGSPKLLAHRVAFMLHKGEIPCGDGAHGTVIMHKCDNRLCCNPSHLIAGSQSDNVADMDAKGRRRTVCRYGSDHPNAKMSEADVLEVLSSSVGCVELARKFGVSKTTILAIRHGKTWSHIRRKA